MLNWIREKFGPFIIGGIILVIALVFVFYGVFSPRSTRGLHEASVAGKVNGESITISEFRRAYDQRLQFFKQMGGGNINEELLKSLRIKENVFQELAQRKLLVQEAKRMQMLPADEAVRQKIREIPAFQKDGKFDPNTYKQVLAANNYTPGGFESMMREDLTLQQWGDYFRERVHVSDEEIKQDFLTNGEKRNVKYVLLTEESAKKGIKIGPDEIGKFLKDPNRLNLAKSNFESNKEQLYKGKTFDQVKDQIAQELIAGEKTEEIKKVNEKLAGQLIQLLSSEPKSAKTEKAVTALLKPYGLTLRSTGLASRKTIQIPGVGPNAQVVDDAFAAQSPIQGKAKQYPVTGWTLVAVVVDAEHANLEKLAESRDQIISQLQMSKGRELEQALLKRLTEKASIDANPAVISDNQEG